MRIRTFGRTAAVVGTAVLVGAGLVSCAGDNGGTSGGDVSADDIEAALEEGGEITYWNWTPQAEAQVAAFEEAYPNVTVNVVDTAAAADHNLRLQNAISAGSGVPDVAQLEYQSIPQFVLPGELADLTAFGFDELEDDYTASTWNAVTTDAGIWGLPQDSGPMALFYNTEVFDGLGLEIPTTWDEYIEAGKAISAANPGTYITNDYGGDAGFGTSMIWQAGGQPFQTDGETVTVNLEDEGTKRWADTWNQLVENDLLGDITGWSDEWFQALSDGTIASMPIGAWMPGVLEASAPGGAGKWRVAPMPTYDGEPATAENGGSATVVMEQSENKALAAGFLQWLNAGDGVGIFVDEGGFPATTAELSSEEFLNYESEYFGGQKINEVLAAAADSVVTGWEYLPWQAYANSIYPDTVGQSYLNQADINEGLAQWQERNVSYGSEQGFEVSE